MINILGTKRVILLLLLIALNVAFAASLYLYMIPTKQDKERQLRGVRGQASTVQSDIDRMQVEFSQLADQQSEFDLLKEQGFFSVQGRRQAEMVFEKIQNEAGVISAVVNIQSGALVDDEEAQKAEHKVLVSPIKVKIEALDDVDVYRYVYLVEKFFPGHITVEAIELERKSPVTGAVLRSIASGANPELVSADIELSWRTMIPESDVITTEN